MKIDAAKNPNYVVTVIEVDEVHDLEGMDNLRALRVFGMQALVGKDVKPGDKGLLFSTEVQMSEEFARENNLHRHTNLNANPTEKPGYLEDNRRVKAIRLRGHQSDSLFMPMSALDYLKIDTDQLEVGMSFDAINGREICRKYQLKQTKENTGPKPRVKRVDLKTFPMHIDSENYWRNEFKIPANAPVVVTQKLHGTSVRYGRVPVVDPQPWYKRVLRKLAGAGDKKTFRFVAGSRQVVKSIDFEIEGDKQHYYADDLWTEFGRGHNLEEIIPNGFLVYGELVGFTPTGGAIQKGYTYDLNPSEAELYVYRVATITEEGVVTDLSWPAVKMFCRFNGLKHVPELTTTLHKNFNVDEWMDQKYHAEWVQAVVKNHDLGDREWVDNPVPLSPDSPVDEGLCVRYDGPSGIYILKAKAPVFLGHETKMLDEEVVDVESEESV